MLQHRQITPEYVININDLPELDYIDSSNGSIRIGALVTNRTVELSPVIKKTFPMLAKLQQVLGDVQTRNWGTLIGNLCVGSPTSDPAPALIALEARIKAVSVRGERVIPLDGFFIDYMKTALAPDEIATELQVPNPSPHSGSAYHKERVRAIDSPIASIAATISLDAGLNTITSARIVLQAVGPTPIRAKEAENILIGDRVRDTLVDEAAAIAATEARPIDDVYGSAEYKREMVKVVARYVIPQAIDRAEAA